MTTLVRDLKAAFADNPILAKDSLLAARRPATLAGAVLVVLALLLAVAIAVLAGFDEATRVDSTPETFGRPLFVGVTVLILALQGVLLPVLASTTLAAERERGTLDLLTTSALSPGRIVAGKLGGLLWTWLPYALLAFPFFTLPMWAGEVGLVDVLAGFALVLFNGVVLLAGGLLCSAFSARTRTAATLAFVLAFVVLWPLVVGPSIALVISSVDDVTRAHAGPFFLIVLSSGLVLAAHAVIGARGQLAPRAVAHRLYRWRVTRAALIAVPVAAAASPLLLPDALHDAEAWRHFLSLPVLFLMVGLVVFEVASSGGRAADAVSPARAALLTARQAALGLSLAAPLLVVALPGSLELGTRVGVALFGVIGGGLYLAMASALTAAVARLTAIVPLRVVLVGIVLSGLALLPVVGLIAHDIFVGGPDWVPLAWTNPLVVVGAGAELLGGYVEFFDLRARHVNPHGVSAALIGPLFFAAVTALLIPLARRRA